MRVWCVEIEGQRYLFETARRAHYVFAFLRERMQETVGRPLTGRVYSLEAEGAAEA